MIRGNRESGDIINISEVTLALSANCERRSSEKSETRSGKCSQEIKDVAKRHTQGLSNPKENA